ncbi:MAG: hypothetical protein MI750_10555 [Xanthomonadales bacterium]|nr:hypothetical protein [Xanthomonadales bacterium]
MRSVLQAALLFLVASSAWAQKTEIVEGGGPTGTITDGAVSFTYNGLGTGGAANADLAGTGPGGDQLFSYWWYYRISGDPQETNFPSPDAEVYAGNMATLSWTDVNTRGFSADLTHVVTDTGGPSGTLDSVLSISNISSAPIAIDIFVYVDADVAGTFGGDVGTLVVDPTHINVADGAEFVNIVTGGNDAYQVLPWPGIRDLLSDAAVDDLDNTGLPFGPDDFTSGQQWLSVTLLPGETATYASNIGANTDATVIVPPLQLPGPTAIPALSKVGLALLASILMLFAVYHLMRRRQYR